MAVAKTVCSDCGADVSPGDAFCRRCGARIESGAPGPHQASTIELRCDVCGHQNAGASTYCEACGAKLPATESAAADVRRTDSSSKDKSPRKKPSRTEPAKGKRARRARQFEPWQIISGISVLCLIAFFVYSESSRVPPPSLSSPPGPPGNFQGSVLGSTEEIEQLQKTVDAEPNNAAALLRLANALHDQSSASPQLLFRSVEAYKKYLALRPDDPDARVDLGICYFYLTRLDTTRAGQLFSMAINEMQTVVKGHPNHQGAAFNLGVVSLNAGNTEEAGKWLKKAVEINPNSDMGVRAKKLIEQHSFM